jgi:hypothetical protein
MEFSANTFSSVSRDRFVVLYPSQGDTWTFINKLDLD